ncbi:M4 family metallopeptidase [Streptosporangium sp. NPDC000239]|uniref:M4 family metallopeptidase n=1 Tax=Streptosporangium sp. NPDC000239 TaxID=3154248 RepID=UPI00332E730B
MNPRTKLGAVVAVAVMGVSGLTGSAGASPGTPDQRAIAGADRSIREHAEELRLAPGDALTPPTITSGPGGLRYLLYRRTHHGLPVYGGEVIVSTDGTGTVGNAVVTGQRATLNLGAAGVTPRVSAAEAAAKALGETAGTGEKAGYGVGTPRLLVHAMTGHPRLAWETVVTGGTQVAPVSRRVFVDALDGTVVDSVDQIAHGIGNSRFNGNPVTIRTSGSGGRYSMIDPNFPNLQCGGVSGGPYTKSTDSWGNGQGTNLETACVDVMFGVQKFSDMLKQWLSRSGVNGTGGGYPARVGLNTVDNQWNGSYVYFGHNQANDRQLVSLDMVAHEYGHAVFDTSGVGGPARDAEGKALAESTGDIFGALTEHYVNHPADLDEPDYLVGEEVNMVGTGPIRYMFNPSLAGDPNCYPVPSGLDPHRAAGPQNHWFYLLAEGTNPVGKPVSPVCGGPSRLTGIGIVKAGQIFYSGLQLRSSAWTLGRSRLATVHAAKMLFTCAEVTATKAAWTAVNVGPQSGEDTC